MTAHALLLGIFGAMFTNSQNLVIICLSIGSLITTGKLTKVKVNYVNFCGK